MKIEVNPKYQFLYTSEIEEYREIVFYGGRGSGKTFEITQFLIFKAITEKCNILCLREYNVANKFSLVSEFKRIIEANDLEVEFKERMELGAKEKAIKILVGEIVFLHNGSRIMFGGINDRTVFNLKSISGIKYCWIDEAGFLTEYAHRILKPTIRVEGSKIFYSFNPNKRDDFLYQKVINDDDPLCKAVKVNWYDNLKFPRVLDVDRENDERIFGRSLYAHIWEGEVLDYNEHQVIDVSRIGRFSFDAIKIINYQSLVISMDTAFSVKESADFSVIGVFGMVSDQEIHLIRVLRGRWDFSSLIENLRYIYDYCSKEIRAPDQIVIENKASGQSLIQELERKTTLRITKVTPVADKYSRVCEVLPFLHNGGLRIPIEGDAVHIWVKDYLTELEMFRADMKHDHDDQVDMTTQALMVLLNRGMNYDKMLRILQDFRRLG